MAFNNQPFEVHKMKPIKNRVRKINPCFMAWGAVCRSSLVDTRAWDSQSISFVQRFLIFNSLKIIDTLKTFVLTALLLFLAANAVASESYRPGITSRASSTFEIIDNQNVRLKIPVEIINGAIVYQNDMVLVPENVKTAVGIRRFRRWPNGIIPYHIQPDHPYREQIIQAIETLNKNTKLWFRPTQNFGSKHISIVKGDGCYSGIGLPIYGDSYKVSLGEGCQYDDNGNIANGRIFHELLHAAGLFHEQSRSDRDNYVNIHWGNIQSDKKGNFKKASRWWLPIAKDIGPYNFASVMLWVSRLYD